MERERRQLEPLSPELALVDPELAAAARERLPEVPQGHTRRNVGYESASRFAAEYERAARESEDEGDDARPARRRGRYASLGAALLAIPLALAVVGLRGGENVDRSSRPPVAASSSPSAAAEARSGPGVGPQTAKGAEPRRAEPRRTPAAPRRSQARRRDGSAGWRRPRPAPVVRWPPVAKATFYWFQLYRVDLPGTQKILDAWPRRPGVELTRTWTNAGRRYRLVGGRYRWEVWPQFGSRRDVRYTTRIAQGSFRIVRGQAPGA